MHQTLQQKNDVAQELFAIGYGQSAAASESCLGHRLVRLRDYRHEATDFEPVKGWGQYVRVGAWGDGWGRGQSGQDGSMKSSIRGRKHTCSSITVSNHNLQYP